MADYGIQVVNNTITTSGQCRASCNGTVIVGSGSPQEASFDVVVAFGTVSATNTNILAAAKAELQRVFSITPNQGGTDRQALFGGRTL